MVDAIHTDDGSGYSVLMEEELLLRLPEMEDCAVVAGAYAAPRCRWPSYAAADAGADPAVLLARANEVLAAIGQPPLALLELAGSDEDIPLGPTGKVLKRQLRERYASLHTYAPRRPAATAGSASAA